MKREKDKSFEILCCTWRGSNSGVRGARATSLIAQLRVTTLIASWLDGLIDNQVCAVGSKKLKFCVKKGLAQDLLWPPPWRDSLVVNKLKTYRQAKLLFVCHYCHEIE